MIAVVMRVDEIVHGARAGAFVDPIEAGLGLRWKLAVHDDDATGVHEIADGAAAHREESDVATDRREHASLLLRAQPREQRRPERGRERRSGGSGKEVAAIFVHGSLGRNSGEASHWAPDGPPCSQTIARFDIAG